MIKIENTKTYGFEAAVRSIHDATNPLDKSDSGICYTDVACHTCRVNRNYCKYNLEHNEFVIGIDDMSLMSWLCAEGSDHCKFMRMITVSCDITAPLYWWSEFDTHMVGTVTNSCIPMDKIASKEITLDDFSHECLDDSVTQGFSIRDGLTNEYAGIDISSVGFLQFICDVLNVYRCRYLETKDMKYLCRMKQLLPSSYKQKRTLPLNYEILMNIYSSRKNNTSNEWYGFCKWVKTLPYSNLIMGEKC